MHRKMLSLGMMLSLVIVLSHTAGVAALQLPDEPAAVLLASGLEGSSGSTIGPGGALYVAEGAAGRIARVDPQSGEITTYGNGLPPAILPIGGAVDIAFIGDTAYVLVSMVGSDLDPESDSVVGIYRMDGPGRYTVIADLGEFSMNNPLDSEVEIPTGVYYALEPFAGGFLVTDGHHNRVLSVTLDGEVSVMMSFANIVPTGLAVWRDTVYMAEAGPNPHNAEDGKVLAFTPGSPSANEVASGAPLLVDVEYGRDGKLYALAQGEFPEGSDDGAPAIENTGSLVEAKPDGTFTVVVDGLDRPTSLEFIGNTAYVVTLGGEVWMIDGVDDQSNVAVHGQALMTNIRDEAELPSHNVAPPVCPDEVGASWPLAVSGRLHISGPVEPGDAGFGALAYPSLWREVGVSGPVEQGDAGFD